MEIDPDYAVPEKPKLTLTQILEAVSSLDNLEGMNFDPTVLAEDLRAKVDAIYTAYDRLLSEASRLDGHAEDFALLAKRAYAAADRLKDYVQWNMEQQKFEKLPGEKFVFVIQVHKGSIETDHIPTAEDCLKFPKLVKRMVGYSWDKGEIATGLANGEEIPFAKLKPTKKVHFKLRKGLK